MTLAEERKAELAEERRSPMRATDSDETSISALEQAELLRTGRLEFIGAANLAVEIAALGPHLAFSETGLPRKAIPVSRPYTWDDIMKRPIEWPETA